MTEAAEAKNVLLREEHIVWYTGNKMSMIYYTIDSFFDGPKTMYYRNGQISNEMTYKMGQLDGEYKAWTSEGVLVDHITYDDGMSIKRWHLWQK